MASDLFPIRRSGRQSHATASSAADLPRGNPLADAVLLAFRQTFGLTGSPAPTVPATATDDRDIGTIVPQAGEINP